MSEHYRALLNEAVAKLPESWAAVDALGGYTLSDLLAALNKVGIGPEDIEVCGNGKNYGLKLWLVRPDDGDDDDADPDPSPQPKGSATV